MKGIKKTLKFAGIGLAALIVIVIAAAILGGDSETAPESTEQQEEQTAGSGTDYVGMVKAGYLGEYTDETVSEALETFLSFTYQSFDWSGGTLNSGESIVLFTASDSRDGCDDMSVMFVINEDNDEVFLVGDIADGAGFLDTEDMQVTDMAYILNLAYSGNEGYDFDTIDAVEVIYGAAADYDGDRAALIELYGKELPGHSVNWLMEYYAGDVPSEAEADDGGGIQDTQEAQGADGNFGVSTYVDNLYPVEGGDDIVSLYTDTDGRLCIWYGNGTTGEEYFTNTYDSYAYENDVLYGYSEYGADEFEYLSEGYVDVLLTGYGSTHYQSYMTEDAYFRVGADSNGAVYIADGDELKNFARDNSNIGTTVTFTAEVSGNYAMLGQYLLYCYCGDGSVVKVIASAVDGLNLFEGDKVSYTGVLEGLTGVDRLQFNTVSIEIQ